MEIASNFHSSDTVDYCKAVSHKINPIHVKQKCLQFTLYELGTEKFSILSYRFNG